MASFASPAFFHLPNPTLVINSRLMVQVGNTAAEKFFGCQPLTHESDLRDDNGELPLAKLGIQLQSDSIGWAETLERARLHQHDYQRVTEGALPELPPSDEFAFRLRRSAGNSVIANFSIYAWDNDGEKLYTLLFYRRRRSEHPPADFISAEQDTGPWGDSNEQADAILEAKRAKELAHLKSALYECGPRIGALLSGDGKTCYLNHTASGLCGGTKVCSIDWLQEKFSIWDASFTHVLPLEEWPQVAARLKNSDIPEKHYGITGPDGKRIVVALEARCLLDPVTGSQIGTGSFGRELGEYEVYSAQKQDEMLRSFETITGSVPHFVWTAHRDGARDWFSKQWCEYTGLTLEECLGDGWMTAVHPDDIPRWMQLRQDAIEHAKPYEVEVRCRRHDGVYRWTLKRGCVWRILSLWASDLPLYRTPMTNARGEIVR